MLKRNNPIAAFGNVLSQAGFVLLSVLFFLSISACSGGSQLKLPSVTEESYDDSVDTACAYFYFLWGKSAEAEDKFDEAQEAYEKALVCDEQADYVNQKLAVLLVSMGKKERAILQLEKMLESDPSNQQNRALLGNVLSSMGRTAESRQVYEEMLKVVPDDPHSLMMLGALYAREKNYGEARKKLERLVEVDEQSYAGHSYLAKLYREMSYFDKSAVSYEKALSLNWSPMLAYETADLYESRKNYEGALGIYLRLLEDDESNTKLRGRVSRIYLELGQIDESLAQLEQLKDYTTDSAPVDLAMGRVLLDEKRYDQAIALFEKMVEQGDSLDIARSMLALSYYESGDKTKAKEVLGQVPAISSSYENSIMMLVQILIEEQDVKRAIELLENVIAAEQTRRPSFYYFLADLMREQGSAGEGIALYERATKAFPDDYRVWFEYGLFLDRLGNIDQAMAVMEKVLVLKDDDPYALNYIGYTWADRGVNLEKALEYVAKAVELKPKDGFVRDSLGWVYYNMADYEQAVTELEIAVSLQPDDPTINEHLGDAYEKTGKLKQAAAAYETAVSLYQDEIKRANVKPKIKALQERDQ